jgi:hypothetical protein
MASQLCLDKRETAAILAALRLWQVAVLEQRTYHALRDPVSPDSPLLVFRDIHAIATDDGVMPLSLEEFDALAKRINTAPEAA